MPYFLILAIKYFQKICIIPLVRTLIASEESRIASGMSKAAKGVAQPGCSAARRHLVPFVISEDKGGE